MHAPATGTRHGSMSSNGGSFNGTSGAAANDGGGGFRAAVIDANEIDAPHVEALVASKRARWLALEMGANDGWARGAETSERARERYDEEEDETRQTTSASTSTSGEGESDAGANDDVSEDGSLMRLYDAGIRGTHPLPGSLALPKTPASALGKMPAVSLSAATRERQTVRFTLEIAEIYFEVGALETIEGTMALYDVQTRTKVSENFHFSWPNAKQSTIAAFTVPAESLTLNIRLLVHFTHLAADEGGIEDKVYTYKDLRKAKVHAEKERQRVLGMEALRQHEAQASRKVSCIGALIRRQHSVSRERGREPEHFQEAEHARVGRAADFRRARGRSAGRSRATQRNEM